jgi:hypothetical protein
MSKNSGISSLVFGIVSALIIGCGGGDLPELGSVSGKVTMDGKPMDGVIIAFFPESGGPSTANVDAEGQYQLSYTEGVAGTKVGPNTVNFSWPTGIIGPPIPSKYAEKSESKVDIKAAKTRLIST